MYAHSKKNLIFNPVASKLKSKHKNDTLIEIEIDSIRVHLRLYLLHDFAGV